MSLPFKNGRLSLVTRGRGKTKGLGDNYSWVPTWIVECECRKMFEVSQRSWVEGKYQQCLDCERLEREIVDDKIEF